MRQIIATSAGFSISPQNKRVDRYILSQARRECPKVCFLPTASGDAKGYIQRFYNFFSKENCTANHLPLFKARETDLEAFILDQDIIYVGGGNTKNMLAVWREWGLDLILKKAYQEGVMMCGISAGSICWFEHGITDSIPGAYTVIEGLGLLKGSNCPFANGNVHKLSDYQTMIEKGELKVGLATEIGVGLHYVNEQLAKVVCDKKGLKAFSHRLEGGNLYIEELTPEYLVSN